MRCGRRSVARQAAGHVRARARRATRAEPASRQDVPKGQSHPWSRSPQDELPVRSPHPVPGRDGIPTKPRDRSPRPTEGVPSPPLALLPGDHYPHSDPIRRGPSVSPTTGAATRHAATGTVRAQSAPLETLDGPETPVVRSAPAPTRTGDLQVRSLTLYPAELRAPLGHLPAAFRRFKGGAVTSERIAIRRSSRNDSRNAWTSSSTSGTRSQSALMPQHSFPS